MRLREWLVVSQVALAFVLLVGAGLLIASFDRIRQVDLGVKPQGVLTFELHLPSAPTTRRRAPGSTSKPLGTSRGPRRTSGRRCVELPATGEYHTWGRARDERSTHRNRAGTAAAEQRVVSGTYFRSSASPSSRDASSMRATPWNGERRGSDEVATDALFPGVDPLGADDAHWGDGSAIVGGIRLADVAVDNEGRRRRRVPRAPSVRRRPQLGVHTGRRARRTQRVGARPAVRRVRGGARPAARDAPARSCSTKLIGRGAAQRVFTLRILMTFAGVALLLAALGSSACLSYGVRCCAREFSIRLALGAQRGAIRANGVASRTRGRGGGDRYRSGGRQCYSRD